MTIEEKRKALAGFCNSQIACEGCVLYSQNCGFEALDDAEIEKSYDIAYGQGAEIEALKAEIDRLTAERDEARRDCAVAERNHALAVEERVANVKGFTEQLKTARADAVRVFADTVIERIIRKKAETSDYWQNDVKRYRAMQGYADIEHEADNFLRGYNEAVDDVLALLDFAEMTEGEQ